MDSVLAHIALTMLTPQLSPFQLLRIYELAGSAEALVEAYDHIDDVISDATKKLKDVFSSMPEALKRAEEEVQFCEKHNIKVLAFDGNDYPQRLKNCDDAPLVLYYCGNADLNKERVLNVIGTRNCTTYGQDIIRNFTRELHDYCPDALVVSGLAYGVDIHAHRNALLNGMETVGVLAHGLDTIYPALHRETAKQMVTHGGLLTEYPHNTRIEKRNFVQRNRIVAGMSDACVLVESAAKGGGLITADISLNYNREVFAFPGNVTSPYSEGCNKVIRDKKAHLATSAADFVQLMGWENASVINEARSKGIERELFPDLTDEERAIVEALKINGDEQVNLLIVHTGLPISTITTTLFTLEMKGVVQPMAGGMYHLLA